MKAKQKANTLNDFELLFNDSPEYFLVERAKMVQEGDFVRFICFTDEGNPDCDVWYPINKLHRIKRYVCKQN